MILVAFRHGLRSSELVALRWDQIDFTHAVLHVRRAKQGTPATHPIIGDEMRALRKLQREQDPKSPFVFTSERGSPFTTAGIARMVFARDNNGHDTRALQAYLGHRNIHHGPLHRTVRQPLPWTVAIGAWLLGQSRHPTYSPATHQLPTAAAN